RPVVVPGASGASRPAAGDGPVDLGTFRGPITRRGQPASPPPDAPGGDEPGTARPSGRAPGVASPPVAPHGPDAPAPRSTDQERPVLRKRPSDPPAASPARGGRAAPPRSEPAPTVRPPARRASPRPSPTETPPR